MPSGHARRLVLVKGTDDIHFQGLMMRRFKISIVSVSALSLFAILWSPLISQVNAAADSPPPTTRHVMLFIGSNEEMSIFDPLGGQDLQIVTHEQLPRALSSPHPFGGMDVVVWGRNVFRDAPKELLTDSVQQAMADFVRDGGDLVFFEQFAMGNMDIVQKLFGIKVGGGAHGAQIDEPDLQTRAAASGYTEQRLAKVRFYNSYLDLPKEASVWLRGGDKTHSPTGVIVPFGKGRIILLATNMDPADRELDKEFFDLIYHFKQIAKATQPPIDPPPVKGDPMDWPAAAEAPALRQMLDPATYESRFKAARQKIDLESLRDPGRPTGGEFVFLVLPGSTADKLGMKKGDIVTAVDGVAVGPRSGQLDRVEAQFDGKRQLVFWSPGGGEKTVESDGGRFGYWYRGGSRPDESYARATDHDPRWDDQVLVAAANFLDDPDLAETALLRAQQAGYDGRLLYPLAAKIAFQQFRYDDALAFGWHLISSGRSLGNDLAVTLNQAALLDFKIEQSLELTRRFPNVITEQSAVEEMAKDYRAMPPDQSPNPIAQLPHLKRKKVATFMPFVPAGDQDFTDGFSKWAADLFNHEHKVDLDIPSDHYNLYLLNPSFANVAVTVHFDLYDTDDENAQNAKAVSFALFDTTAQQPTRRLPPNSLRIGLPACEEMSIEAFGLKSQLLWTTPPHIPWRSKGTLRMVILHNRCEASLDGRRIFYGPVVAPESSRKYGLWVQIIGMSGRIDKPVVEELIDPATTTRPQAGAGHINSEPK